MSALPDKKPDLPVPTMNMTGKTVIVTGANTGIGKEAAALFASMGAAHVILASRSIENAKEAVEQAQKAAKGEAKAEVWQLDLSSFASVKAFVDKAKKLDRLDVVLNNAGVAMPERIETADGFETLLQVNGLATAYIAYALLPLLQETASKHPDPNFKPHVTLVTSGNVFNATAEHFVSEPGKTLVQTLNDAGTEKGSTEFSMQARYGCQTKGLNVLNAYSLSQISGPNVVANCVCPGLVKTDLSRNAPEAFKAHLRELWAKIGLEPFEGARNVVWASTEITPPGALVQHCKVTENPGGFCFTKEGRELAPKVWEEFQEVWKEKGLI